VSALNRVLVALASLVFPGIGHALIGLWRWSLVWAIAPVVSVVPILWSVWMFGLSIAVRLACIVHAFIRSSRQPTAMAMGIKFAFAGMTVAISIAGGVASRFVVEAYKIPSVAMYPTLEINDYIFIDRLSMRWRPPVGGEVIVFRHPCVPEQDYIKRVIATAGQTVEVRCGVVYVDGSKVSTSLVQGEGCQYLDEHNGRRAFRPCSRHRETFDGRSYDVFNAPVGTGDDGDRDTNFPRRTTPPSCADYRSEGVEQPPSADDQRQGSIVQTKSGAQQCEPQMHYVVPAGHLFVLGDNRPNSNDSRFWGPVPVSYVKGRAIGIWWPPRHFGAIE
jgi:signal peptidase I